ncbi:MAG: serine hydrolase [Chloroflexi bacterium]|nr:serine hydrolase [Chloroflexota bacterium]
MRIARDTSFILRWVSLFFIAAAIVLTMIALTTYSRERGNYPPGMTIAGVPVGSLDPQAASQRLLQAFNSPVEIQYAGAIIQIDPAVAGFQIDTESMLAAADLQRTGSSFWGGFWDFLWNRQSITNDVPLISSFSEDRLRAYLKEEIASRYDQPSIPAAPQPGQVNFLPGISGQELDIDRAIVVIDDALKSPTGRTIALTFQRTNPGRPPLKNLEILIKQIIDLTPFDGVAGVYLQDLQTGDEMHFGYNQNIDIPIDPDIAFTASSTIKIPILVSVYKNLGPDLDQTTQDLILEMITKSENPASDALMSRINGNRGPLVVSDDMKVLGLSNTFLAGYFFDGAPLLESFSTQANQRNDVSTSPDAYNQTTPSDIGSLLVDLYQCAQNGGGGLVAAFAGKITQVDCQQMIEYLKRDRIGVLIEAGLPEGTQIAHKHGWISGPSGIIQNISDAAIVYTPGGNYVLTIYIYHPIQAVWDPISGMIAKISEAVYNYYNLPR